MPRMQTSRIEWTQCTWNPLTGCTPISSGCAHCYAKRMSNRLQAMEQARGISDGKYSCGFELREHPEALRLPLTWRQPRLVFVNSMSDMFHRSVSMAFIEAVFGVMETATWHVFQVLTKRSGLLRQYSPRLRWPENVWMGVTVESEKYKKRLDGLRSTQASVKFVSIEPLLGPMGQLNLDGIDWVIVGGESGPGARVMQADWVREVRDQCIAADVPFFFKQWGGVHKKKNGRVLDDRTWEQYPTIMGDRFAAVRA
jgi:protein gp37